MFVRPFFSSHFSNGLKEKYTDSSLCNAVNSQNLHCRCLNANNKSDTNEKEFKEAATMWLQILHSSYMRGYMQKFFEFETSDYS